MTQKAFEEDYEVDVLTFVLTVFLPCQQEGGSKQSNTVHEWLRPLVCVVSNWALYS